MFELGGILALYFIFVWLYGRKRKRTQSMPIITYSDNGYEGHLDFLEQHGFITKEERHDTHDRV